MAVLVNLRHLEEHEVRLEGKIRVEELEIDTLDSVIKVRHPLAYALEVQKFEEGLLVTGALRMALDCECVRCLKAFEKHIELPDWRLHLPFDGEEAVRVVNDCVDLTPFLREDILLEFPQHPLCDPGCNGLPQGYLGKLAATNDSYQTQGTSATWSELNKLKLNE